MHAPDWQVSTVQRFASTLHEVPASFDLASHARRRAWEFPHEAAFEVTVRLDERLVPAVHEIFGPHVACEPTTGGALVRLKATHRQALVNTLLPYGAAAEVLEPASLRSLMATTYGRLADIYA